MSRSARDWAWALPITPPQKLVLLALSEHADDSGDCWPSLTRLTGLTGLARSTVPEALSALQAAGLIARHRGGSGRSTRYQLLMKGAAEEFCLSPATASRTVDTTGGSPADGLAASPGAGLVREAVVREPDQGSPPGGPSSPGAGPAVVREPDPNRQLNRQEPSVNRHCSAPAAKEAHEHEQRRRGKARRIPHGWRPSERVSTWAEKQGMTRDWVADQIEEFVVYWGDRGDSRKSWDATFMNRLRTLQAQRATGTSDATGQPLAAKDYRKGATPLDQIPWLNAAAVG